MPLHIGCTFSDRVEALVDGRVAIEGATTDIRFVEPQSLFRQTLRERAFDVAELSLGSHIAAVAKGERHYVGLPVFLSRSFRHSNLYIRTDRGIRTASDLKGKRIGLVDFQQTAAVWLRGLLADEFGVGRSDIEWVTAGLHAPVTQDRMEGGPPPGISVNRSSSTLDVLLQQGDLDAVISPTAPHCFVTGDGAIDRLWPDYRAQELSWWRRRSIFPIMHALVLRRTLAKAHPELPGAIYRGFDAARGIAARDLASRDFPKLTLPWITYAAAEARAALGGDPWTYGLEANRPALEAILSYAYDDGLTPYRLAPEDLFS